MKSKRIHILCECGVMVALAVALSLVSKVLLEPLLKPLFPFGGSVTLFSMLPICLLSIRRGIGWGTVAAFCFAWFQILEGGVFAWGLTPGMLIASLLLDYLLAFTVLGLAGIFRNRGKGGMLLGIVLVCLLRFAIHFLAGVLLWANFAEFIAFGQTWINRPVLYSLVYNGGYMLPETLLTVVGAVLLLRMKQFQKLVGGNSSARG